MGAQRCGTTYLSRALDAHPDLTMARPWPPEPKVFCDAELTARGADSYHRTWFAHARDEEVLGDKSTSYLEDPDAPERAAEMLGEVEVVALLRDPVRRAVSHWRFSTANGLEARPLEDALLADLGDDQPWDPGLSSVSPFAYLRRGRYAEQLEAWSATFPTSTRVVLLEDLLADPDALPADRFTRERIIAFIEDTRARVSLKSTAMQVEDLYVLATLLGRGRAPRRLDAAHHVAQAVECLAAALAAHLDVVGARVR